MSGIAEIVAIYWGAPTGTKYYGNAAVNELAGFTNCPVTVEPRLNHQEFLEIDFDTDLTDDAIRLDFQNVDREIERLFALHGDAVKVEIFTFSSATGLLASRWFGQLNSPDEVTLDSFVCTAESGFMSRQSILPRRRLVPAPCQATFGGKLSSLSECARNACPYNRHLGGSVGLLNGAVPYTSCAHTKPACAQRFGSIPNLPYYAVDVNAGNLSTYAGIGQTIFSPARGAETVFKRPVRVIIGSKHVRGFDLLAWRYDGNGGRWISMLWGGLEGPLRNFYNQMCDGVFVNPVHMQVARGLRQQPPLAAFANGIGNFSQTAHFWFRREYSAQDFAAWKPENHTTLAAVDGLENIRIYTSPTAHAENFTKSRVWGLLECYTNRNWGRAYAHSRFHIADWIAAAATMDEPVRFTDPLTGTPFDFARSDLNVELEGRITQDQIVDICRAGRLSVPFQHNGKYTIKPIMREYDLANVKHFYDGTLPNQGIGTPRNIEWEKDKNNVPVKPYLSYSQTKPRNLVNKVVLTFDDVGFENDKERPLTFEDEPAQLRAGRAQGDDTLHVVERRFQGTGIRNMELAVKIGWSLLHLGEFDSGGLKNNLRIKFKTWFSEVENLKRYDVIHVQSQLFSKLNAESQFEYFRIMKITRHRDLTVTIVAQAYPNSYYIGFERRESELGGESIEWDQQEYSKTPTASNMLPIEAANIGSPSISNGKITIPINS